MDDTRPYEGLKVLDMSQGVAGPSLGSILARQGASVIKIEPPEGDWSRLMGGGEDGLPALTIANNLGKRSLCVDAGTPEGRAVLRRLVAGVDVLIENFRPGVMKRLGMDVDELRAAFPRLICVSITGFGEVGPMATLPGTDGIIQAFTGMTVANRDARGVPQRIGMLVPDTITGLYSSQAVGAALFARHRTGRGRHIKLSLTECAAAFQSAHILDDVMFAGKVKPALTVPAGVWPTADGYLIAAALRNDMFDSFCKVLGTEEWLDDPRYASNALRAQHAEELNGRVAERLLTRPAREWVREFQAADVLSSVVNDYAGFLADPHTQAAGWIGELAQAPYGTLPMPRLPGSAPGTPFPPAPRVGEHSAEVLADEGFSPEEIATLKAQGAVR